MNYTSISPSEISANIFDLIGNQWMLISAYDKNKGNGLQYNTMTASWGTAGVLWGKNVVWCYIRPQRYTKEFVDSTDTVTLSFFEEEYRKALTLCGRKSGRECDKIQEAGLHAVVTDNGEVMFEEAKMTIVGRKLYEQKLDSSCFVDNDIADANYPAKDYHTAYCYEIIDVRVK